MNTSLSKVSVSDIFQKFIVTLIGTGSLFLIHTSVGAYEYLDLDTGWLTNDQQVRFLQNFSVSGNVGIGTTTPDRKLTIQRAGATSNTELSFKDQAGNTQATLGIESTTTNDLLFASTAGLRFFAGSAIGASGVPTAETMRILSNGNVGIGTNAPSDLLTVNGPSGIRITGDAAYQSNLVFGANDTWKSGIRTIDNGNAEMRIWHANAQGQIILANGYNGDQSMVMPTDGVFVVGDSGVNRVGIGYTAANIRGGGGKLLVNGNVGIGTATPGTKLDVSGDIRSTSDMTIGGVLNLTQVGTWGPQSNINPENGWISPIYAAISAGKPLYYDEEFAVGFNSVGVYNNSGGGSVVITREADATAPNRTGYRLAIVNNGGVTSPGLGGFILPITSRANATFVQRFRAKVPVGYSVVNAENSQGTNAQIYWLTKTAGTGKWEEYIRIVHSGNTGSFSVGGHVYLTGPAGPVTWYLASANVYEVQTSGNLNIVDSQINDISWSKITSKPTTVAGYGITDMGSQTVSNSDMVDSLHGSQFMRSDANNSVWNANYFGSNKGATSTVGANNTYGLEAYSTDGGAAGMSFHRGGYYAVNMGLDPDNIFRIGGWSAAANRWQLDMSGNNTIAGQMTATQFNGPLNGNAATVTNGVYTTGDQTISGNKTFNNDITVVGKVITDTLVNRTVAQLTVSGSILPNATSSQKDLGANGNRWNNLYLAQNAYVTGSVIAGSFAGNGSAVTSINPTNISAGTAGISISGNAENVTTPTATYKHLGAWGVGRTAVGAILVNTAYLADNATNAGNADTVDGYHEGSFFRARGTVTGDAGTDTVTGNGVYAINMSGYGDIVANFGGVGSSTPSFQLRANYGDSLWFRASRDAETTWDGVTSRGNRVYMDNYHPLADNSTTAGTANAVSFNGGLTTTSGPTFADVYTNGWFRNNANLTGLYNQAVGAHFYASAANIWNMGGGGGYPQLILRDNHQSTIRGYLYSDATGFGLLNNQGNWMLYSPSNSQDVTLPGNAKIGGGISGRRLDIAQGSDGLTIGQDADNSQTIQAYIDGQWANRATYAGGCCNTLKLQPDIGNVTIGAGGLSTPGQITASQFNGALNGNATTATNAGNADTTDGYHMNQNVLTTSSPTFAAATIPGNLNVSTSNTTGGGIKLADDGDIVDLNDGYAAMRFSYGVRIHAGNSTGAPVITLASNGQVTASQFNGALNGNANTATTFSTNNSNYKGITDGAVAGLLMWKNYGNNHTIFDASQSTSPSGSAVNNTNSASAWTPSYPTLMGWNGSSTYGVRVDSARIADGLNNMNISQFTNNSGYLTAGFASSAGQPASTAIANETGYGAFQAVSQGNAGTAGAAFMSFHRPGAYASYFGLDTDNQWKVGGWSMGAASYPLILGNGYTNGTIRTAGDITMNKDAPTLYFIDTNEQTAMIHNNGNLLYFLGGCGANSAGWCTKTNFAGVGGYWPLYINMNNNDATFGGAVNAFGYFYLSDERLKKNIKKIVSPLDKILSLNGYTFEWKNSGKKSVGLIAQEVEKVFPELVSESKNGSGTSYKTVEYGNMTAPLIEAVKEIIAKIDSQEEKYRTLLEEQRKVNESQQNEIEILKKQNREILKQLESISKMNSEK